jgi:hypothetical protein
VLEQRHDLEEVRALLGHARIDTTQIYAKIRPPQLKRRWRSTTTKPSDCWARSCALGAESFEDRRSGFAEHSNVPKTRELNTQRNRCGGSKGIRTRVSALSVPPIASRNCVDSVPSN